MNPKICFRAVVLCFFTVAPLSIAGSAAKKTLTAEAYERWNHIDYPALTDDGRWAVYTLRSGSGAQELVVRATTEQAEFRTSRGVVPKLWVWSFEAPDGRYYGGLPAARVSADSRFVLFSIEPEKTAASGQEAHPVRRKSPSLGILSLPEGQITRIEQVSFFVLPKDSGRYVAYRAESSVTPSTNAGEVKAAAMGRPLVLRDLISATEVQIEDVEEFAFDAQGQYLAYTIFSVKPAQNGVYIRRLVDGHTTALLSGAGCYRSLVFDAAGTQLAFLSDHGSPAGTPPRYSVYYAASPQGPAVPAVPGAGVAAGLEISVRKGVTFTPAGNALVFAVRPIGAEQVEELRPAHEQARFQLFRWHDPWRWRDHDPRRAPPMQPKREVAPEYLALYHIELRQWVQLGSAAIPTVVLTDNARHAIGIANLRKPLTDTVFSWTADVSRIDTRSGQPRLLQSRLQAGAQQSVRSCAGEACDYLSLSPGGRYLVYFAERRWWSVDLATGRRADLTGAWLPESPFGKMGASGPSSQRQHVSVPPIAGWAAADRHVLLYDAYDLWAFDPAGRDAPRNLTGGVGRRQSITFRLLEDADLIFTEANEWLSPRQPLDVKRALWLIGLNQHTMASGVWRTVPGEGRAPEPVLMLEKRMLPVARARRAEQYLLTLESFAEHPDLWAGTRFDQLRKLSEANPQQREYRWGTAELIEFTSDFGVPSKGILYKPEDFNASRQYPLIVSIYEIESTRLHQYGAPAPLRTSPHASPWPEAVSRGYLVFVPDILSTAPYPAQSALAAVIPAVRSILDRGFVDPARIALTGHSFGAYQASFILTQTNLFRCAIIDGGFYNSISHSAAPFGPIAFAEIGQGRHGGSLWERPFVYIANSPVFYADRVQTPVLMMHNDKDSASPMSQGLELFSALRRNGKEVYLMQYDGEGHGLLGLANRLDWDRRVTAFLDHFLKDAPRASWMSPPDPRHAPERFMPVHTGAEGQLP